MNGKGDAEDQFLEVLTEFYNWASERCDQFETDLAAAGAAFKDLYIGFGEEVLPLRAYTLLLYSTTSSTSRSTIPPPPAPPHSMPLSLPHTLPHSLPLTLQHSLPHSLPQPQPLPLPLLLAHLV